MLLDSGGRSLVMTGSFSGPFPDLGISGTDRMFLYPQILVRSRSPGFEIRPLLPAFTPPSRVIWVDQIFPPLPFFRICDGEIPPPCDRGRSPSKNVIEDGLNCFNTIRSMAFAFRLLVVLAGASVWLPSVLIIWPVVSFVIGRFFFSP